VPVIFTDLVASYSAANEWCAIMGTAASSIPTPRAATVSFARIALPPFSEFPKIPIIMNHKGHEDVRILEVFAGSGSALPSEP